MLAQPCFRGIDRAVMSKLVMQTNEILIGKPLLLEFT